MRAFRCGGCRQVTYLVATDLRGSVGIHVGSTSVITNQGGLGRLEEIFLSAFDSHSYHHSH